MLLPVAVKQLNCAGSKALKRLQYESDIGGDRYVTPVAERASGSVTFQVGSGLPPDIHRSFFLAQRNEPRMPTS
jgi:hypothetical protein